MKNEKLRNHNGRFTSPETERRRAWAAMRLTHDERRRALPGIGCMTIVEHLGALQRAAECRNLGDAGMSERAKGNATAQGRAVTSTLQQIVGQEVDK